MQDKPSIEPAISQPILPSYPRRSMPALATPVPVFSEEEEVHVRIFIRKLVEAFAASAEAARTRFNLSNESEPTQVWNLIFRTQRPDLSDSVVLERSLRQLASLHRYCLEDSADCFASLLLNNERLQSATLRARIKAALETDANGGLAHPAAVSVINIANAFRALRIVASKFKAQVEPARRGSYQDTVSQKWEPDWRCQGVVWALIQRLGNISPPPILATPYQELKEAAFACLFERDYIDKQWTMCSFENTLLKYIPRPHNWDADISWLGVSFFVALPLTGFVQVVYNDSKLPTLGSLQPKDAFQLSLYWALFFTIFFSTAVGMILFYSSYRSRYSMRLMQRAAMGTDYEQKYADVSTSGGVLRRISTVQGSLDKMQRAATKPSDTADSDSFDLVELAEVVTDSPGKSNVITLPAESESHSALAPRPPAQSAPALYVPPPPQEEQKETCTAAAPTDHPPPPVPIEALMGSNDVRFEKVSTSQAAGIQEFFETDEYKPYMRNSKHSAMSPDRAIGFGDHVEGSGLSSASFRLYQASMFVQRIYGSIYFDESWAFGLSEAQLHDAIRIMLQTDSTLGRQYAAFSFAAIAVASRGVPTITTATQPMVTTAVTPVVAKAILEQAARKRLLQFNFSIFSFLGALTFVAGLTAAVLSDLILRQMSFTQISQEGTAHFFANRFGFFIRVVGGLNSSAGMFLSTSVLHFLLNIFKVDPFAVIILGGAWLILGTMVTESFFSNYHFWRMSEILDDVTLIAEPDVTSPSPIIGVLQLCMAQIRKVRLPSLKKRREKRRKRREEKRAAEP